MKLMMGAPSPELLYQQLLDADEAGVRLEVIAGIPIWEFHPSPLHQNVVLNTLLTIRPTVAEQNRCGCFRMTDAYIRFPDGSLGRPDISVFCEVPPITQEALTVVPDAVVEIVSPGSEKKDLEVGPGFYLSQGVKDVVVYDPRSSLVLHHRRNGVEQHCAPVTLSLDCGCTVSV